jgi:hypothetical protein
LARRFSCPPRRLLNHLGFLHIHPRREASWSIHPLLLLPCPTLCKGHTGYTLFPVLPVFSLRVLPLPRRPLPIPHPTPFIHSPHLLFLALNQKAKASKSLQRVLYIQRVLCFLHKEQPMGRGR